MPNKRLLLAVNVFLTSMFGLLAAASPRLTYAFGAEMCRPFCATYLPDVPGQIDLRIALGAASLAPFIFWLSWRAAGAMRDPSFHKTLPFDALSFSPWLLFSMPGWMAPLVSAFGKPVAIAGILAWFIASLSLVARLFAGAARMDELEGKRPPTALLDGLFHIGGAPGVWAARDSWPGSKALDDVTREPPYAFGFLLAAAIVLFAVRITT